MIYTSYYANMRNLPETLKTVSISQYPPKWAKVDEERKCLAPTKDLLMGYKSNPDVEYYFRTYIAETDLTCLDGIEDNEVLLCFEKPSDFCHRQIVQMLMLLKGKLVLEYQKEYRIGIVGSRTFIDEDLGFNIIDSVVNKLKDHEITFVSGGASGADTIGEKYAKKANKEIMVFHADWEKYGKSAGYLRNKDIVKNSDILIALWDGISKGTIHSIKEALKLNKVVVVYDTLIEKKVMYRIPLGLDLDIKTILKTL